MPNLADEQTGIAVSVTKLKEIYQITDDQLGEALGDQVYTAMLQNNYEYITMRDMINLADMFGLVFVMNFQSLDVYLAGSEEQNNNE